MVERYHSHHHAPLGGLVAVGDSDGNQVICAAMLSRPVSRILQASGACAEVHRVASDGSTPHAASMAIGAMSRAALALGWRRLVSYTLLGEAGTSYRAAGWWPTYIGEGGEWSSPSRPREASAQPGVKVRWEYGPDAMPMDPDVDRIVRDNAGKIDLRPRPENLPLLALAESLAKGNDAA
jgi:hypothetical protein